MVSPSSCLPVLPLGSSGGGGEPSATHSSGHSGGGASAHLQAATSTTPESSSGPVPHNFLMDVHAAGVMGASPPGSHMKQELAGAGKLSMHSKKKSTVTIFSLL